MASGLSRSFWIMHYQIAMSFWANWLAWPEILWNRDARDARDELFVFVHSFIYVLLPTNLVDLIYEWTLTLVMCQSTISLDGSDGKTIGMTKGTQWTRFYRTSQVDENNSLWFNSNVWEGEHTLCFCRTVLWLLFFMCISLLDLISLFGFCYSSSDMRRDTNLILSGVQIEGGMKLHPPIHPFHIWSPHFRTPSILAMETFHYCS